MSISEEEIIRLLGSGNERDIHKGYKLLAKHYAQGLSYYIMKQLPDGSIKEVEDIRLESLTAFVMNVQKGKFRQEASIKTFLFRVAKNLCIQEFKNAKKIDLDTLMMQLLSENKDSQNSLDAKKILEQTMLKLTVKCQQLITAFYWRGWTHEEIGEELGKNSKAVKQQLYRCKEKLRELMGIKK